MGDGSSPAVSGGMKAWLLAAVAASLLLAPWAGTLSLGPDGSIHADGIRTSAAVVMALAVSFSAASWSALAWASGRGIRPAGVLLGVIAGASLAVPFAGVLGPMAGVVVGVAAGFAAAALQKGAEDPAGRRHVAVGAAVLAAAYASLILAVLVAAQSTHVWDTGSGGGDGIASWSGTAEGIEGPRPHSALGSGIGFAYFPVAILSLAAAVLILRREGRGRA